VSGGSNASFVVVAAGRMWMVLVLRETAGSRASACSYGLVGVVGVVVRWGGRMRGGGRVGYVLGSGVVCGRVTTAMKRGDRPTGIRAGLAFSEGVLRCRVVVAWIVAGACGVLLVGVSGAVPVAGAAVVGHRTVHARIAWKGCGKGLQCARVPVPLDWARPSLGTISLAVIRHRASGPGRRIGSLFLNWGGPGVAGVAMVKGAAESDLDALSRGRFDLVSWDPRGAGESTHVRCFANDRAQARFWGPDWSTPTTKRESAQYERKAVAFVRRCVALSGRLLAHDSTADTARDLDYLRRLVGDRRLNYRGLSYGSFIGETYANMFPRRVRAIVLDGVLDPVAFTTSTQAGIASTGADVDLVLAKLQSLCQAAGPARCALAGHGPVKVRVSRLLARLRHRPIPAPSARPPHRLSYGDLLLYMFANLGRPASWPQIAAGLEQAASGNGSAIETALQQTRPLYRSALNSATALQCADKQRPRLGPQAWPSIIGRVTRVSPFLAVAGWWLAVPCAAWPVVNADRYAGPWNRSTPNPVLVIGTRHDPQTAYAGARRVARLLGNAKLLTLDGYGHTTDVDPSTCIDRAVTAYLVRPATARRQTCHADRQPFDPDFGNPLPNVPVL
jgi:pimeloyl-ACP methyl ester carboxylesterase